MLSINPKDIENQIISTISRMGAIYRLKQSPNLKKDDTGWADVDDTQGLITTSEALECVFIPYWSIPSVVELFWEGKLIDLEIIKDSIRYLVQGYLDDPAVSGPLGLSGTPYIDFTKRRSIEGASSGIKRNWDFLDTACFVLCALLDAKAIQQHGQQIAQSRGLQPVRIIEPEMMKAVDTRIADCIKLMNECDSGPGSGWTFTNDKDETEPIDFLYFTWNAIEAIEVLAYSAKAGLLPSDLLKGIMGSESPEYYCDKLLVAKLNYLSGRFLSPVDAPDKFIGANVVKFEEEDTKLYYNLFALSSLFACGSKEKNFHIQALAFIINHFQKNIKEVLHPDHGKFVLAGAMQKRHQWDWGERAFIPLLCKTIARFIKLNGEEAGSELLKSIGDFAKAEKITNVNDLVEHYLGELENLKCSYDGKQDEVWDSKSGYSIYFTERVIESLVRVFTAFYPSRDSKAWDALVQTRDQRSAELAHTPIATAGMPVFQVVVSADVVTEAIKEQVRKQIGRELIEAIKKEVAADVAKLLEAYKPSEDKVQASISEGEFIETLKLVLNGLVSQIQGGEIDKDSEKIYNAFLFIGSDIERHVYNRLLRSNGDLEGQVSFESFKVRISAFMDYIAGAEMNAAAEQCELDYNKLINEIFSKYSPKKPRAALAKTKPK
jgi:hypothetical protein